MGKLNQCIWLKLGILLSLTLLCACTTISARNKQIMEEYNNIAWQDGIDASEALTIVKHYMHIRYAHYGVRYLYPEQPENAKDQWVFRTTFRNENYERDPEQLLTLYVEKKNGEISSQLPRSRGNANSIANILKRFDKVNREDGISRSEAIDIMKHHYYVEAKNRYWMYEVNFRPKESKRFWIFELQANPNARVSAQRRADKLKNLEGIYLAVNKVSGELTKERSYLSLIQ